MHYATRVALALFLVLGWAGRSAGEGEEQPWFDMVNCGFCKSLGTHVELLNHMDWKHYDLSSGLMSITQVEPASMAEYKIVCALMEETGKKLAAGEQIPLCRSCQAFSGLMAKGMKTETVFTDFGSVQLSMSSDPEIVKGVHAWAATTRAEMDKMAQASKEGANKP